MHFTGTYKFQSSSEHIYAALLNPIVLKASIPGCESAWYAPEHGHIKVRLVTPVPGLEGPYDIAITVLEAQAPHLLVLHVGRSGRIGGKVDVKAHITLKDEEDGGSTLVYETTAELEGPVAIVNNPLFIGIAKHALKTFFKNLNAFDPLLGGRRPNHNREK